MCKASLAEIDPFGAISLNTDFNSDATPIFPPDASAFGSALACCCIGLPQLHHILETREGGGRERAGGGEEGTRIGFEGGGRAKRQKERKGRMAKC